MDHSPQSNPEKREFSQQRISALATLGAAFIIICILFLIAFISFQPNQLSLSDLYFPSSTLTLTSTPSLTPSATPTPALQLTATQKAILFQNASATAAAHKSTATAIAYKSTATAEAHKSIATTLFNEWDTVVTDLFNDNHNQWRVGVERNEIAEVTREIAGGKYHWTMTANQQTIQSLPISETILADFYLTLDIKQANGLFSTDYGVILREDADGNFYYFGLNNNKEYAFFCFCQKKWIPLIDWTKSFAILISGNNKLTLIGQGSLFTIFINDQYITTLTDDRIANGMLSFAVRASRYDNKVRFEFDNLALKAP